MNVLVDRQKRCENVKCARARYLPTGAAKSQQVINNSGKHFRRKNRFYSGGYELVEQIKVRGSDNLSLSEKNRGECHMDRRESIIELVQKIHSEKILERIYKIVLHLWEYEEG